MYDREELKDGDYVTFVGVHILKFERWIKDYGIPPWEFAFTPDEDDFSEDE